MKTRYDGPTQALNAMVTSLLRARNMDILNGEYIATCDGDGPDCLAKPMDVVEKIL